VPLNGSCSVSPLDSINYDAANRGGLIEEEGPRNQYTAAGCTNPSRAMDVGNAVTDAIAEEEASNIDELFEF
jgi:hypothetical protein